MNAREFFYLVAQMRQAQNSYFREHNKAAFRPARKLENLVDAEIARVRAIVQQQEQQQQEQPE